MFPSYFLFYTDPGTGAMVWQLLVAAFIGAAFYFRQYANKIRVMLASIKNKRLQPTNLPSGNSCCGGAAGKTLKGLR
jgi:hypothetical protein